MSLASAKQYSRPREVVRQWVGTRGGPELCLWPWVGTREEIRVMSV